MRKAVLGVVVAVVCWAGVASAVSVPELRATVERKGNVRLRWRFTGDVERATTTVEIERSGDGTTFAPLVTIRRARKRQGWLDRVQGGGPYAYRARVVTPGEITGWSAVVATGALGGGGGPTTPPGGCPAGSEEQVLALVNAERSKLGIPPLRNQALLARAAATRSEDMAATGSLTHTGWVETIRAAGYGGAALGENIAYGYSSAGAVVTGWMRSDGHRANILRSRYSDSGVGCVKDARGRLWWTHDFGG